MCNRLVKGFRPLDCPGGVELCLGFDASFIVFHAISPPKGSLARQIEFERGGGKKTKTTKTDMVIAASLGLSGFQQFFMGSALGSMAQAIFQPHDEAQRLLEEKISLKLQKVMPGKTRILHGVPGEELALYAKKKKEN